MSEEPPENPDNELMSLVSSFLSSSSASSLPPFLDCAKLMVPCFVRLGYSDVDVDADADAGVEWSNCSFDSLVFMGPLRVDAELARTVANDGCSNNKSLSVMYCV